MISIWRPKPLQGPTQPCEDCEGCGKVPYQSWLGWDGSQTWSLMDCPTCNGRGEVPVPEPEADDASQE